MGMGEDVGVCYVCGAQVSTLIGYGSPNKADTHDVHGAPLGPDETAATRKNLGWTYGEFEVPQDVYDVFRQVSNTHDTAHSVLDCLTCSHLLPYSTVGLSRAGAQTSCVNRYSELDELRSLWLCGSSVTRACRLACGSQAR